MGDDETPTPNTSSSFAFFAEASMLLAERMENVATLKRRYTPALDIAGAKKCDEYAVELLGLAEKFAAWPTSDKETVARERPVLVPRLTHLTREVADLVNSLPPEARQRLPRA